MENISKYKNYSIMITAILFILLTNIRYKLSYQHDVSINIYNLLGQKQYLRAVQNLQPLTYSLFLILENKGGSL